MTLTIEPAENGSKSTLCSTVNQLLCRRQRTDTVDVSWSEVLGEFLLALFGKRDPTNRSDYCKTFSHKQSNALVLNNQIFPLGESFQDISRSIDTSIPKLQCLVVFGKETDVETAELLLDMLPAAKGLVVASYLTKRDGAQLYLTNYLNNVSFAGYLIGIKGS